MTHTSDPQPHHATAAGHGAPDADAGHAAGDHGSGDDVGHAQKGLGPVDVRMWGAGIVAAAAGLVIAACFVLATSGSGAY